MTRLRVGGAVLCGGESRRMGRPKAWLPFGEELLLARVVRLLGEAVTPVVVVAAPEQELPSLPAAIRVVRDAERGRGPLQGIAASLSAFSEVDAVYITSCDAPFLSPAFVTRMIDLLGDASIAVPDVGGYRHPLAAVYRIRVRPVVERLLADDRLRPLFLFDEVPTRLVSECELQDVDPGCRTMRNVNTPQEYDAALREMMQFTNSEPRKDVDG